MLNYFICYWKRNFHKKNAIYSYILIFSKMIKNFKKIRKFLKILKNLEFSSDI
jgi:hypothetical protein